MAGQDYHATARILGALAHPMRLRILELLREREMCVCEMVATLQRRQAYVSQQLAVLRQAGLVADRREGLKIFYRLADPALASLVTDASRLSNRLQVSVPSP